MKLLYSIMSINRNKTRKLTYSTNLSLDKSLNLLFCMNICDMLQQMKTAHAFNSSRGDHCSIWFRVRMVRLWTG